MGVRIRKNDMIHVIAGKEKGKRGKVIRVIQGDHDFSVMAESLNMRKKHMKPSAKNKEGGILETEGSIHISNVSLVCPKCDKASSIGFKIIDDKNFRYCKKCKEVID